MDIEFIGGYIQARYDRLLKRNEFNAFSQGTKSDFLRLLNNYQYGLGEQNDFEMIILQEELKHKQFLLGLIDKDHLIFKVLYRSFDHLFLSNLFKSVLLGFKYQNTVHGLSNFNEEAVENYLIHGDGATIDLDLKAYLDELKLELMDLDGKELSDYIIYKLHLDIVRQFNKNTDVFIKRLVSLETDIDNVLLLLRTKLYKKDITYFEKNVLIDGTIEKHILVSWFSKSFDEISKNLSIYFDQDVTEAVKNQQHDRYLSHVSYKFMQSMDSFMEDLSFQGFNFAPVIHFTRLKRLEIENLKEIYYKLKEKLS
ncbi:V-type ATP synthase subunit C [Acholeplasma oculi]|uniref:V-type ATP synthase subunit C n=1 Tax=Acholeplasma oculi TaxID=35623 RepID=A0A061AAZ9_9MOLU|nr:V-type ATPase subunit [Acholeplasma oculi]CDR30574.1 V-type ATP synthase subunit C [Acholeplasma oculi]SKC46857.1 V/A-type H+-transporting ATPase subunit C [Acholeplasma oculi]SUT89266.1 V-type ATP synthase subunit C [Acholeplasma oculi]